MVEQSLFPPSFFRRSKFEAIARTISERRREGIAWSHTLVRLNGNLMLVSDRAKWVAPRVLRNEVMEHPFSGRAKRDRAPRGAEERSDGAPSSRSREARSPP